VVVVIRLQNIWKKGHEHAIPNAFSWAPVIMIRLWKKSQRTNINNGLQRFLAVLGVVSVGGILKCTIQHLTAR